MWEPLVHPSGPHRTTQGSLRTTEDSTEQPRTAQEGTGRAEGREGAGHHRGHPARSQGGESLPVKGYADGTTTTGFAAVCCDGSDPFSLHLSLSRSAPSHRRSAREQFVAARAARSLASEGRTATGMLCCAHVLSLRMRR